VRTGGAAETAIGSGAATGATTTGATNGVRETGATETGATRGVRETIIGINPKRATTAP
jgi:hypothetical protein